MMSIINSLFFFVIAIGVLVTVHEFGHFIVARGLGVKVLRFSVGFGKALWSWRRSGDETEYVIATLPLGGYVQMLDEREGPVDPSERHRAFNRKPVATRFAIVVAGPLFNFVFAVAAYWLVFVLGVTGMKPLIGNVLPDSLAAASGFQTGDLIERVGGRETPTWNSALVTLLDRSLEHAPVNVEVLDAEHLPRDRLLDFRDMGPTVDRNDLLHAIGIEPYRPLLAPVIGQIEPGGAADQAGFAVGDRVVNVDGQSVSTWEEWVDYVRAHPEQTLSVEVERNGTRTTISVRPARVTTAEGEIGRIGAGVRVPEHLEEDLQAVERYSPLGALGIAVQRSWDMSAMTLRMLWEMVVGEVSVTNLGGPIRIAQYAGYTASVGAVQFIGFLALISISLGVLNLLPVPVLDGGHLLYYLIEMVKGAPLSEKIQQIGQRIGIALLVMVMVFALYNDLAHLFGGGGAG